MADLTLEDIQKEMQRQALTQGLLAAGFGILGAGPGSALHAVGQGGLLGLQAASQAKQDYMRGLLGSAEAQTYLQALSDQAKYQQAAQNWPGAQAATSGQPTAPPPPLSFGMQDRGTGQTPTLPAVGTPRLSTNKMNDYQVAIARAKYLEQQGVAPKYVEAAYAQAEKMRPEVKETRTLVDPTGQRVTVNIFKDGTQEVVPFAPDKEKLVQVDTGPTIAFADPFSGNIPEGAGTYTKSMTPGERATNTLGYARLAQEQAQADQPQLITDNQGNVFAVNRRNATGVEVTGPGGTPLNKGDKPLSEVQGNATAFGMRMKSANDIINGLEDKGVNIGGLFAQLANNSFTNPIASANAQMAHQAKLNFMTASLRKESGAAISPSEFESEDKKYFPQVGDSKAVLAQKRQARQLAIQAMTIQAGPGAKNISGSQRLRFDAQGNQIP